MDCRCRADGRDDALLHAGGITVGVEGSGQLRIEDGATVAVGSQSTLGQPRTGSDGRLTLDNGTLTTPSFQSFENRGIVEGDGLLAVQTLNNVQNGQVLVGEDDLLRISGSLNTTQTGRVEIIAGELEIGGSFTNGVQGRVISDSGMLRMRGDGRFSNDGSATYLGQNNRVHGKTNNWGSILAVGNSELTFFNDVLNLGTIKASEGATITMLGALEGNGITGPGTVFLEGVVAPGPTPRVMSFGGDVTLGELSKLAMDVVGAEPGTEYDQFNVTGELTLSGELHVLAQERLNDELMLTIATAGELSGAFSWIPELGADIGFGVRFNGVNYDYENDAVTVSLLPAPSGDFDDDGTVDGADFLTWQRQLGATADPAGEGADGNGDGVVNGEDLAVWREGFVGNEAAPAAAPLSVPEPSAAALLLVGLLSVGGRRVEGRRALRL